VRNAIPRDPDDPLGTSSGGPGTVGVPSAPLAAAPVSIGDGTLDISNAEAVAAEVETKYGSLSDEEFLTEMYETVLGRAPDQGGFDYWLGQLSSGTPRAQVFRGFYASDEGGNAEPPLLTEVETMIRTMYPDWAWAMNNDEVRDILLEAVDPARGMDDVTFKSKIRQTEWWKNTESTVREWDARSAMDPATAQREKERWAADLMRRAVTFGGNLDQESAMKLAEKVLRFGLTDSEINDAIAETFNAADPKGDVVANLRVARDLARDYMVKVDDAELTKWAQQIAVGTASQEDLITRLSTLAKAKFSQNEHLMNLIDSGATVSSYFSEHQQMIAREMDLDLDQVNMMDPKYARILTSANGASVRPMDLAETRSWVRSQPEWQKTTTGRKRIAETTQGILQAFGKVA
jgi:hypothetical protein